ncbi:hypothetical protein [Phormidium sp. CCY1219]|uniref:hypothetical protein n=1 Tax=Phormidium sp. CCY1219 TaxID=2886104 RepID=UPI002D1E9EAA|nr:hypothetical protein [Phormidium sp. CCY1219]MEB3826749.1 hypothetical protein [Phormidium sp. CCY1219]
MGNGAIAHILTATVHSPPLGCTNTEHSDKGDRATDHFPSLSPSPKDNFRKNQGKCYSNH